jgi:hypothetical protein
MSTAPVCLCDATTPPAITNLPGLSQIEFRAGDFNDFRRALLTPLLSAPGQPPLEQSLTAWQSGIDSDPSVVDLAVMMVEWWAYLADILTFYNERIANEDYLRTAALPETPAALIKLLGYRPRPAIGATGMLAALVSSSVLPGQTVTLPKGLQFQSKPGPGGAPQTFELNPATTIGLPDQIQTLPAPSLISLAGNSLILQGSVTSLSSGTALLLGPRDASVTPSLIWLSSAPVVQTVAGGGKQTVLTFTGSAPSGLTAANARLMKANQSAGVWTANGAAFNSTTGYLQMASLVRQIRPQDQVLLTWTSFVDVEEEQSTETFAKEVFLGGSSTGSSGSISVSKGKSGILTRPTFESFLATVTNATDVLGDASSNKGAGPTTVSPVVTGSPSPIPVLHTQLAFTSAPALPSDGSTISVAYDWVEVGTLVNQPPAQWNGTTELYPIQPAQFPPSAAPPILLQDSNGVGVAGTGGVSADGGMQVGWATPGPISPSLQPPISVFYNLLPVSCGKTVANEILGSGDATQAGQSFKLSKSPVTYLANGNSYASTIVLTVDGLPWTEVASFYNQPANAQIFVTREDSQQNTWVDFGDGVNGARLTTGQNNVVATYRIGGGAASPPAGKLTVIAQSYPGLRAVVNPVAVTGGSDPDPAALLKQYAPRSVLSFGSPVSVFDYQAFAAQAPGVTMAAAVWSWDAANQRAGVVVYVAGEPNIAASVQTLLSSAADPNRPATVLTATAIPITLTMTFIVIPGADTAAITLALQSALCDPIAGLFSPAQLGIGQSLFNSQIEAVCLAVAGVTAIKSSRFGIYNFVSPGPLHSPGEGNYFSLDPNTGFVPSLEGA